MLNNLPKVLNHHVLMNLGFMCVCPNVEYILKNEPCEGNKMTFKKFNVNLKHGTFFVCDIEHGIQINLVMLVKNVLPFVYTDQLFKAYKKETGKDLKLQLTYNEKRITYDDLIEFGFAYIGNNTFQQNIPKSKLSVQFFLNINVMVILKDTETICVEKDIFDLDTFEEKYNYLTNKKIK